MGSFIGSVVLHVTDTARASQFWTEALDYVAQPENPDFLVPPEWRPPSGDRQEHGPGTHLHLDSEDRTHLDLWVDAGQSLEDEVDRLVALGARRIDWTYADHAQHVVLLDPEGNLFCVCA